ncbi:hypothetical protein [Halovivax gelatinilyticus]|uniref:hypothetical protein n=1 Tax=Halovivax gelatinilyticus TaxID=2961597 RepID=UPI0020CA85A3|nr:hypothetical protein [Halovivax gelatinilyticus]
MPNARPALLVLVAVGLAVGLLAVGTIATDSYGLSTSQSTDTPTQTVTIHGDTYTITSIATADPDASFSATIDVPDGSSWVLDIYNDNEQIEIDSITGGGPDTVTVPTDGVEPGTYALTLQSGGDVQVVKPLVVEGYAVDLNAPSSHPPDEPLDLTVDATPTAASGDPPAVEVVVWNGDSHERLTAESVGEYTYEATVDGLEPGSYQIYAAAVGTDTVMGEPEVLGASGGSWVTVEESDDSPPENGDDGGDDDEPGDGDDADDDGSGDDANGDDGDDTTGADGSNDDRTDDAGSGDAEDDSSDDADTIEPADPEDGDDGDDGTEAIPAFGLVAGVFAVLFGASFAVRRRG